jgi:16S rRNA (adenine1518-N6/adenine1519-N6)-dimethyltransferase
MKARKRFGQHFLEPAWSQRLVAALEPSADDVFVEIGPGRGALTLPLAHQVRRVVCVELDRDLVEWLGPRLPPNVTLVSGDVLQTPLADLLPPDVGAGPARVVGNLPYNISTPVLFRLIEWQRSAGIFRDATVMLQREVAERIAANPGSKAYGVLSIALQMEASVTPLLELPPGAFRPAPEVWSSVVRLAFHPPAVQVTDRDVFDRVVKGVFLHRRKTLANALKATAEGRDLDTSAFLASLGIDPARRPETLSLDEFAAVANRLAAGRPVPVV